MGSCEATASFQIRVFAQPLELRVKFNASGDQSKLLRVNAPRDRKGPSVYRRAMSASLPRLSCIPARLRQMERLLKAVSSLQKTSTTTIAEKYSLMYRYGSLFHPDSPVAVCKVQFGTATALGLEARKNIPAASYILETCSSMSTDITHPPGPSLIQSHPSQLVAQGHHSILGPFRLVNHDCEPNAQVR